MGRILPLSLAALVLGGSPAAPQPAPPDYRLTVSAFKHRVVDAGRVIVAGMDLGRVARDTNRFTARVTNKQAVPVTLGLSLRAMPGMWLRGNWQRGYRFTIPGRSTRAIAAVYVFRRMTPEATLRVTLGPPIEEGGGIGVPEPIYDTTLAVGAGNPSASDPRLAFDTLTTGHLDIFAWRGSPAARQLSAIGTARETALTRIADILQVDFTGRIRLVFYPDSASKTSQTGHIGNGFASDRTIVEIFNDSVQLDPYHEIAHIVGYQRGSPPAMLDEGFAVFVSELLGADALKYLGSAGMTVQQTVCAARRSGSSLPLGRLFRFTDIGSDSTVPEVSYPESASVVAFLIQRYGIERFRQLYARLQSSSAEPELRRNAQVLEELYGADVDAIERAWVAWLACQP